MALLLSKTSINLGVSYFVAIIATPYTALKYHCVYHTTRLLQAIGKLSILIKLKRFRRYTECLYQTSAIISNSIVKINPKY